MAPQILYQLIGLGFVLLQIKKSMLWTWSICTYTYIILNVKLNVYMNLIYMYVYILLLSSVKLIE